MAGGEQAVGHVDGCFCLFVLLVFEGFVGGEQECVGGIVSFEQGAEVDGACGIGFEVLDEVALEEVECDGRGGIAAYVALGDVACLDGVGVVCVVAELVEEFVFLGAFHLVAAQVAGGGFVLERGSGGGEDDLLDGIGEDEDVGRGFVLVACIGEAAFVDVDGVDALVVAVEVVDEQVALFHAADFAAQTKFVAAAAAGGEKLKCKVQSTKYDVGCFVHLILCTLKLVLCTLYLVLNHGLTICPTRSLYFTNSRSLRARRARLRSV